MLFAKPPLRSTGVLWANSYYESGHWIVSFGLPVVPAQAGTQPIVSLVNAGLDSSPGNCPVYPEPIEGLE